MPDQKSSRIGPFLSELINPVYKEKYLQGGLIWAISFPGFMPDRIKQM